MFREIVRFRQTISHDDCIRILKEEKRGVLSVNGDDGYPYGMPLNHYYCEADGKIYFHGGMSGHRIDAVRNNNKASYCVIDEGCVMEGDWALTFNSVIVFGRIEFVEDHDKAVEISRELSRKFTKDEGYIDNEVERSGKRTLVMALVPEHITGKRVNEK